MVSEVIVKNREETMRDRRQQMEGKIPWRPKGGILQRGETVGITSRALPRKQCVPPNWKKKDYIRKSLLRSLWDSAFRLQSFKLMR